MSTMSMQEIYVKQHFVGVIFDNEITSPFIYDFLKVFWDSVNSETGRLIFDYSQFNLPALFKHLIELCKLQFLENDLCFLDHDEVIASIRCYSKSVADYIYDSDHLDKAQNFADLAQVFEPFDIGICFNDFRKV